MKRFVKLAWVLSGVFAYGVFTSPSYGVGTRHVALRTAEDLAEGDLQGVAVDSAGRVRAGLSLGKVEIADATTVWSVLTLGKGRLLLATGNDGKLFEYANERVREVAGADALGLTSIVRGFGGRVFLGSLPGGQIYEYRNGKLESWLTIQGAEHVLQLAYDDKQQVLYAATGPEGRLYRITADKKAQVYFDADEEHLSSVTVGNGRVYVGGGDKARLYEVSGPGRARVLYDFGTTEVRAIRVASNGDVYAIANEIKSGRQLPKSKDDEAKPAKNATARGSGQLYRFEGGQMPELLLEDSSELYVSLELDSKGRPYVGTGSEGKVYTVDATHNSVLVADVEARQVSSLLLSGAERYVVASDPAVLHPVRERAGDDIVWTSKVIDAQLRAHFGRLSWVARGELEFQTRSGNTKEPDDTWSPWSAPIRQPSRIQSPAARFVQVRARFNRDPGAILREVAVSFATDNLRAVVKSIEVDDAGSGALDPADGKLRASGGPITSKPSSEISLSWDVENPDKDELRFRLQYQLVGTSDWFDILEPSEKLTKSSYTWQTKDLPEGQYRVRVQASDELSNPPDRVKRHSLESHVVTIDNTAPEIASLQVNGRKVRVRVVDGVGPIARLEATIAGRDEWVPFAPIDGIFDDPQEEFELDLSALSPAGPTLITLRAFDQENNQVVRSVTLR